MCTCLGPGLVDRKEPPSSSAPSTRLQAAPMDLMPCWPFPDCWLAAVLALRWKAAVGQSMQKRKMVWARCVETNSEQSGIFPLVGSRWGSAKEFRWWIICVMIKKKKIQLTTKSTSSGGRKKTSFNHRTHKLPDVKLAATVDKLPETLILWCYRCLCCYL